MVDEAKPAPAFQFSLRALILATASVAGCSAVAIQWGLPAGIGAAALGLAAVCLYKPTAARLIVGCVLLAASAFYLLGPGLDRPPRRESCDSRLRGLTLALMTYHNRFGSFPPAESIDLQSGEVHSWRAILAASEWPQGTMDFYRLDQPWNGPDNSRAPSEVRSLFSCPQDSGPSGSASYLAIVGEGTAWPRGKGSKLADFTDGPDKTLLLIEVDRSGIAWNEPRDLTLADLDKGINPPVGRGPSSNHGTIRVAFADGHIGFLPPDTSAKELRALATIAGGD
jgi:hypothetical protein